MGWIYSFGICVNPKDFTVHTHLIFHQVKLSTPTPISKWEVNERLCIGEVGVDLELYVHAHGNDVDLIMEASPKINCPLGISYYIWDLVFCERGSDHIVLLWSHFSDTLKYWSSVDEYKCLNSSMPYLRVLPSSILRISCIALHLMSFLWSTPSVN